MKYRVIVEFDAKYQTIAEALKANIEKTAQMDESDFADDIKVTKVSLQNRTVL